MLNRLKRIVPSGAKQWAKGKLSNTLGIPWNPHGVPVPLMRYLPDTRPIVLVDVGASQGQFTRAMDQYCGVRKALMVEPQPSRIEEIKQEFGNRFCAECAAVAECEGQIEMDVFKWDYSSSILPIRKDKIADVIHVKCKI